MTEEAVDTLATCEECGKQAEQSDQAFCRGCGAPLGPDPLVGTILEDRYEVKRRLGAGAMGAVYEVRHRRLGKRFAMKIIRRSFGGEAEFAARFEQEALSTSRLEHPNCIAVTDYGKTADGLLYLVMEFLEGTPLSEIRTPLSAPRALDFIRQILLGLQHAHRAGVVHRDVKPENVMVLDYHGAATDRLKVLDFGIAKLPLDVAQADGGDSSSSQSRLTEAGVVFGTPDYMAPEQALGSADVDERADLYAVGVILWILLIGRPPFEADNSIELLQKKLAEDPPSLSSACPGVFASQLEKLVDRALARNPRERIATAEEFLAAIDEVDAEPGRGLVSGGATGHWASVSTRLQLVAVPFKRVSTCYQSWYGCEHVEKPTWKDRARALLVTGAGRVVFGSALALLLLSSFALAWTLSDDEIVKVSGEKVGEAPKQPKLAARDDDGADKKTAKRLKVARLLLAKYACSEADRGLRKLVMEQPKLAQAHYLRGAALICRGDARAGVKAYARAIELEPSYKEDERVLEDVGGLMTSKRRRTRMLAIDFMVDEIGKPALPMLLSAAVNRDRTVRDKGRAAVIRLGGSSRVDWVTSLHLDLKQLSCRRIKRQRIIERLSAIEDQRVLPILKQALRSRRRGFLGLRSSHRYGCVRKKLKKIVKALEER